MIEGVEILRLSDHEAQVRLPKYLPFLGQPLLVPRYTRERLVCMSLCNTLAEQTGTVPEAEVLEDTPEDHGDYWVYPVRLTGPRRSVERGGE